MTSERRTYMVSTLTLRVKSFKILLPILIETNLVVVAGTNLEVYSYDATRTAILS